MNEMKAYCIAATFADGSIVIQHTVAENESAATMIAGIELGKRDVGPIVGFSCTELPTSWLQSALRALEGKRPSADIVSLVRPENSLLQQTTAETIQAYQNQLKVEATRGARCPECGETNKHSVRCKFGSRSWPELSSMPPDALKNYAYMPDGIHCRMHPLAQIIDGNCMACRHDTLEGKKPSADVVSLVRPPPPLPDVPQSLLNHGCLLHPNAITIGGRCWACMHDNGVA
jgi:hypothetical protein